jgi:protein-ribulosamine 3-kinase
MTRSAAFESVAEFIAAQTGVGCNPSPERAVSGGSINECYLWHSAAAPMFVKLASQTLLPMLEAEAAGLRELGQAHAVRVPKVLAIGRGAEHAILALEWIESGASDRTSEHKLGERLAAQHRVTARQFGWDRDNTIGSTPQINGWMDEWPRFFRERRLRPQLELAVRNGHGHVLASSGERLLDSVESILADHHPRPSLLHGDLWGGNWLADSRGEPVIFDPAVYYGDREADLAMTRLFGGFGRAFQEAYEASMPLTPGFEKRFELYNLYHVLNHANLFGAGYVRQARVMMDRLVHPPKPPA